MGDVWLSFGGGPGFEKFVKGGFRGRISNDVAIRNSTCATRRGEKRWVLTRIDLCKIFYSVCGARICSYCTLVGYHQQNERALLYNAATATGASWKQSRNFSIVARTGRNKTLITNARLITHGFLSIAGPDR